MTSTFAFIDVPQGEASERDRNLARSLARSHAARNAHSRRQFIQPTATRPHKAHRDDAQTTHTDCTTCSENPPTEEVRSTDADVISELQDISTTCSPNSGTDDTSLSRSGSPTLYLPGNNPIDPFSFIPITLSKSDHNILQYYLRFGWPSAHRAESMARGSSIGTVVPYSGVANTVRTSLMDPTLLLALLAKASARMSQMNNQHQPYKWLTSNYMAAAAGRLRHDLVSSKASDVRRTIQAMLWLAVAEWYRGNHQAAALHMNAIAQTLQQQSYTSIDDNDDTSTVEVMCSYDTYMAAELDCEPRLPPPGRITPLSTSRYREISARIDRILDETDEPCMSIGTKSADIATMEDRILQQTRPLLLASALSPSAPSALDSEIKPLFIEAARIRFARGFLELATHGDLLCDEFSTFFTELVPQWPDVLLLCFADTGDVRPEDAEWMANRAVQALRDLLMLRAYTKDDPRQDSLRLTLMITFIDLTTPVPWRSVPITLRRLKRALQSLEASTGSFEEAYHPSTPVGSLMLWILMFGLCALGPDHGTSPDPEQTDWWETRTLQLAIRMKINTMQQIYAIMARYLYCGMVRHPRLVRLMERISKSYTKGQDSYFTASAATS